jgi:hypothetical protein
MTFCYTVLSKTEKSTLPRDQNARILELQRMVHRNKNYRRFNVQFHWKAFWKSKGENGSHLSNNGYYEAIVTFIYGKVHIIKQLQTNGKNYRNSF